MCPAGSAAAPKSSARLWRLQAALNRTCCFPSCNFYLVYCSFFHRSMCILLTPATSFLKLHLLNWGHLFSPLYSKLVTLHPRPTFDSGSIPSQPTVGAPSLPYRPDAPEAMAETEVSPTRLWAGTQMFLQHKMSSFGIDCVGARAGRPKSSFLLLALFCACRSRLQPQ